MGNKKILFCLVIKFILGCALVITPFYSSAETIDSDFYPNVNDFYIMDANFGAIAITCLGIVIPLVYQRCSNKKTEKLLIGIREVQTAILHETIMIRNGTHTLSCNREQIQNELTFLRSLRAQLQDRLKQCIAY